MEENLSQNNHFSPLSLRVALLIVLLVSSMGVFSSVAWIYARVNRSLGMEIAEVVVAVLMILVLALVVVGFRAGFGARQVLRQRKCRALRIYRSFKWCKFFCALWGHIGLPAETEQSTKPPPQNTVEMTLLLDPSPKRGRPATFPIDRWIKVVAAWENRDRWHNTLTLTEFLAEEFGTNADGSPLMSANTYYDWRKKVHAELRKQEATKKIV